MLLNQTWPELQYPCPNALKRDGRRWVGERQDRQRGYIHTYIHTHERENNAQPKISSSALRGGSRIGKFVGGGVSRGEKKAEIIHTENAHTVTQCVQSSLHELFKGIKVQNVTFPSILPS